MQFLLFLSLVICFIAPLNTHAQTIQATSCLGQFIVDIEAQTVQLEKKYAKIDDDFQSIADQNRPFVLKGSKKELVILVHGFMGSPDEMRPLAEKANALGFSAYSALIPGYGGTAKVANDYSKEQWVKWFSEEVKRAQGCFSKIHIVGFSTGGLLATNYIMDHGDDETVQSVHLISPYYETHSIFYSIIQSTATTVLNQISVSFVYNTIGFPDVEVMLRRPESYLQSVPLKAAKEIVSLGKYVQRRKFSKSEIPAEVLLSTNDQVIDQKTADHLTEALFSNRTLILKSPRQVEGRVPHHMMVKEVSPVVRSVENRILEFLQNL